MKLKLQKLGNSNKCVFFSNLLKFFKFKIKDSKPAKKHMTFEERLKKYNGENIIEDYYWGNARGKEL